jgi:hypothetical protein
LNGNHANTIDLHVLAHNFIVKIGSVIPTDVHPLQRKRIMMNKNVSRIMVAVLVLMMIASMLLADFTG